MTIKNVNSSPDEPLHQGLKNFNKNYVNKTEDKEYLTYSCENCKQFQFLVPVAQQVSKYQNKGFWHLIKWYVFVAIFLMNVILFFSLIFRDSICDSLNNSDEYNN